MHVTVAHEQRAIALLGEQREAARDGLLDRLSGSIVEVVTDVTEE
jgi:hypothetical protein